MIRPPGQQGIEHHELVKLNAAGQDCMGELFGLLTRAPDDRAKAIPAECGIAERLHEIDKMRAAGFVVTGITSPVL